MAHDPISVTREHAQQLGTIHAHYIMYNIILQTILYEAIEFVWSVASVPASYQLCSVSIFTKCTNSQLFNTV